MKNLELIKENEIYKLKLKEYEQSIQEQIQKLFQIEKMDESRKQQETQKYNELLEHNIRITT